MHLGSPTGTMKNIHGLPTYVANPPEGVTPIGIIVYIPDAFGWQFVNNRILADHYAKRGNFLVYLPDFMNGSFAFSWPLRNHNNRMRIKEEVRNGKEADDEE